MNQVFAQKFETKTCGKWILAGEHAVLRGHPALVFPLLGRNFQLNFNPQQRGLELATSGERGAEFEMLFWGVLEKACATVGVLRSNLRGQFLIDSNVPIGGGLGASAALCAAVAKFFRHLNLVKDEQLLGFACELENLFHGESSGVDVAVALEGKPVLFVRREKPIPFEISWQPFMALCYTGKRGVTSECVAKVKELLEKNPDLGNAIDLDMAKSVTMAKSALQMDQEHGILLLAQALTLAHSCFERWGLVNLACLEGRQKMREQGAIAVKPTGSGEGGFLLGLWPDQAVLKGSDFLECF